MGRQCLCRMLTLALCLCLTLLPAAVWAGPSGFWDVHERDWFCDSVRIVSSLGLMEGKDCRFCPENNLRRAELARALFRLDGSPDLNPGNPFTDISEWNRDREAILWAAETGVVPGRTDTVYGWYDAVSRKEAALCFFRYANYRGFDTSGRWDISRYADCAREPERYRSALSWAIADEKLLTGPTTIHLRPNKQTSRGEMAVMLARFYVYYLPSMEAPAAYGSVRFSPNYPGAGEGQRYAVAEGGRATVPAPPQRSWYICTGWYTAPEGGAPFDFRTGVEGELTLYARWAPAGGGTPRRAECR